jgi:hypothetical protein
MMAEGNWLFSYGTLRQPEVQEEVFGRRLQSHEDVLRGFTVETVRILDEAVVAVSGSAEHPILRRGAAEDRIEGLALAINDEDIAKADAYETADYRRISVLLASGRRSFVYIHRDDE